MRANTNVNPNKLQRSTNSKHSNSSSTQSITNHLNKNPIKTIEKHSSKALKIEESHIRLRQQYYNNNKNKNNINIAIKKIQNRQGSSNNINKLGRNTNDYDYCQFQNTGNRGRDKEKQKQKQKNLNKQRQRSKDKTKAQQINKLKFTLPRAVIGFDGNTYTVQPKIIGKFSNDSRSLQQRTQIVHKSQNFKINSKKAKSKSQSKNKHRKNSMHQIQYHNNQKSKTKMKKNANNSKIISKQKQQHTYKQKQKQKQKGNTCSTTQLQSTFHQTLPYNYDLSLLHQQIKCSKSTITSLLYIKKIPKQIHSQCINIISKFCFQIKLSKQIFYRTIELMDRYLNQQLVITKDKIKLFAIAALNICIKFDDRYMSGIVNQGIYDNYKKFGNIDIKQIQKYSEYPDKQKQPKNNNKKNIQKQKKQQHQQKIQQIMKQANKIIQQQFKVIPSAQQIFEYQVLILLRQDFKLPKYDLAYWIDIITLAWDTFICNKLTTQNPFIKKIIFRYVQTPQNYFYLTQIVQQIMHISQIFYTFTYPQIILSLVFLISRIKVQTKQHKQIHQIFNQYHNNLQKSNNCLFIDKFGVNQIFSNFLQCYKIQMEIGDILSCCKFLANGLNDRLEIIDKYKWRNLHREININIDQRMMFVQHYWNCKFVQLGNI